MKTFHCTSLCLALGLAACGDDTGGDSTGTGTGTDTTSTSTTSTTTDGTSTTSTNTTSTSSTSTTTTTTTTTTSTSGSTSDGTSDGTTGSTGDGTGSTGAAVPTFDADIWPIINANCNNGGNCHVDNGGGTGGLNMSMDVAYANLVNAASNDFNNIDRIEPGDTDTSYVWLKLNGDNSIMGNQMPAGGGAPLGMTDLDTIEAWILGGAPEN